MLEFIVAVPPGVWALIGTLFGGVALKLTEGWLNRNKESRDDRRDYRDTIKELQDRLDKVEEEVTQWRTRYYTSQEEVAILRTSMIKAGIPVPKP